MPTWLEVDDKELSRFLSANVAVGDRAGELKKWLLLVKVSVGEEPFLHLTPTDISSRTDFLSGKEVGATL